MQLNEAQYKAVHHVTGPMLVTAGPGSGKTRVIVERIRYLTGKAGISPDKILVVTFTRAAAAEMRQRYEADGGSKGVNFGTFHSIFFTILKHAYKFTASDIMQEDEIRKYIKAILPRLHWESDRENDLVSDIIAEISRVKSENYDIETYYPMACPAENFRQVYIEYNKWLKKKRKIDFDDMLIYTYELFTARPDILKMWQEHFQYILVDEFQDINKLQYEVVKMLALPHNNLFIVGDDDQSIYSFRGSKPEYMINYNVDYPDAVRVSLDINYRCPGAVIEAAGRLIAHNKNRIPKNITPYKENGKPVVIREYKSLKEQNDSIIQLIDGFHKSGVSYNDIAIIYRTNSQPQALLHTLLEYNVPVRLKEGVPNIYSHWIAGDILAYVKLALGVRDAATFMRVMNRPNRYIPRNIIDTGKVDYDRLAMLYEDRIWMQDRIYQMESDINAISRMTPARGIRYIEKVIGYGDYLAEYAEERGIPVEELQEKFDELYELASGFKHYGDWLDYIDEYNEWYKENGSKCASENAVTCITMHGSKGLEYDIVIIPDVNEGVIPHHLSTTDDEIEEERRMMYVAMTRAKKQLYLLYTEHRYNRDCEPSRFLEDIN